MDRHSSKEGVLIVGHGSKDKRANEAFFQVVGLVEEKMPSTLLAGGFLGFGSPSIEGSVARLVELGAKRISVVPLMLFAARHVRHDIPTAVADAILPYRGVSLRQVGHLGCHPKLVELSRLRFEESLAKVGPIESRETALVLVSHGSCDERATAEMFQFAELLRAACFATEVFPCFSVMGSPSMDETLHRAGEFPVHRVVIQPHLLFPGRLFRRIQTAAKDYGQVARSAQQWVIAEPLGPDRRLAEAVVELVSRGFFM